MMMLQLRFPCLVLVVFVVLSLLFVQQSEGWVITTTSRASKSSSNFCRTNNNYCLVYFKNNHDKYGQEQRMKRCNSRSSSILAASNDNNDNDEDKGKEDDKKEETTMPVASAAAASDELKEYRDSLGIRRKDGTSGRFNDQDAIDIVMKFGGSSLANANRIDHVVQIIQGQMENEGYRPRAVVCSAMGKTTNSLLSAGEFALDGRVCIDAIRTLHVATMNNFNIDPKETTYKEVTTLLDECETMLTGIKLIKELSPKSLDQLVSYGERCCVRIIAHRLNQIGIPSQAFDAWEVGIITNDNYGDASINEIESDAKIKESFDRIDPNIIAIVTGFIGHNQLGRITTLGRGGSDLTATQLGASIPNIHEVQVWKDVDGILTSDPRIVQSAKPVDYVTYEEAAELAYFGAQILHPIAMYPAMKYNIPVRVKNSYNPSAIGTIITNSKGKEEEEESLDSNNEKPKRNDRLVTALTYKADIKLLDIKATSMLGQYGFLAKIFRAFEKHKMSVDVLASSEVSVSLTLDKKQNEDSLQALMKELEPFAELTLKSNRSILTLIADVQRSSEVLATVFRVFSTKNIKVEMMSQGASKVNISFIVKNDQLNDAIQNIHQCFFDDQCIVNKSGDTDTDREEELYI